MSINLRNVQGNILKGFNKPNVRLLFFKFNDMVSAKAWLKLVAKELPSTITLIQADRKYKAKKNNSDSKRRDIWTHISLSRFGIKKIELPFPPSRDNSLSDGKNNNETRLISYENIIAPKGDPFFDGMKRRADILGDKGRSNPRNWIEPFRTIGVDCVLIVAADKKEDIDDVSTHNIDRASNMGINLVGLEKGKAIKNSSGDDVEHFGFRDGISKPLIRGIDSSTHATDLLDPKLFVLTGLKHDLAWANEGSFLVFRRLRQDVDSFWKFMNDESKYLGISPELLGAKFMGRWKSGTPLAVSPNNDSLSMKACNDFKFFDNDPSGARTPRFSHIRKTYPRDDGMRTKQENEVINNHHRILRRGIPYGEPRKGLPDTMPVGKNDRIDRGLLFICYQKDIPMQFEFIQSMWANSPFFPMRDKRDRGAQGHDTIAGRHINERSRSTGFFNLLQNGKFQRIPRAGRFKQFVMTTGGEYFFSPSISSLKKID